MDALLLHIDTATQICSVALTRGNKLLSYRESLEKNAHSRNITLFVREVLEESGFDRRTIDGVAVSKGPGSFTGLRIGVSTAKGLCYALGKPLIAVDTLQAMAWGMKEKVAEDVLYCPMIDARRMEVYSALYDGDNRQIREVRAEIIDENSFSTWLEKHKIYFFGDGAPKCRAMIDKHPNAGFDETFQPSARYIAPIASQKYTQQEFEDVAYFEPFYLKDFIAGKPRVKGLR
ncbi:MAG: tRNA (adenosine(37)-N6)-threonylcarbamoyltransferase complex dimerization subunit type 1 TsaB [Bacteroidota bacterium]|nr:tRNA (adenosine(37)-N6)-threonylcarbamoyltransferase complex dimerization subunit type 1 TsaB [Bacteroidota bacterium]